MDIPTQIHGVVQVGMQKLPETHPCPLEGAGCIGNSLLMGTLN